MQSKCASSQGAQMRWVGGEAAWRDACPQESDGKAELGFVKAELRPVDTA